MTRLSAPGTRVLLIGTGAHSAASGLPPVPAVMGTLADLGQVLVERCGLAQENLRVVRDPANPTELGIAIAQEAEHAEDVLWVYYVGHGLVGPAGDLYLATAATDPRPGWVAYTALAYTAVRGSLLQTAARSIVVVLDCCFSGRAVGVLGAAEEQEVDLARVHGGYVLAAAARDELALATPGAPHTAFTGELIRLLTEGDPEGPQHLTLGHAYRYLNRTLPARGFPRPRRRASEWIEDLVLGPNPAYRPPPPAPAPTPAPRDALPHTCPYPGLAAFGPGQMQWFFGRERLINELAERLAGCMDAIVPLFMVGPSGAGKSSLLGAGLLSALGKGAVPVPGSQTWPHLLFTPTEHPLRELADRLAGLTGGPGAALREELADDPRRLAAAIREMLRARAGRAAITGTRLVLVVDQFEETFTQCADAHERQVFIRALCAAADGDGGEPPALVVLGLRSDFHDHCATFPELRSALHSTPLFVGPMTAPELREAIAKPAQLTGSALQPGLIEVLLRDLGADRAGQDHDPGALPLLAHALRATWQHREDRTLTVAGYLAAGSVRGAVATTAEAAYSRFDATGQQVARLLMLRLVHVGEGTQDTRRRIGRTRLFHGLPDPDIAATVLEALARARLVTLQADTVEITHEALLHAWPRLREWIDTERSALHIHQQLAHAADAWERAGRDPARLYRGARLGLTRDWATDPAHHTDTTPVEREFLHASAQAVRRRRKLLGLPAVALCLLLLFNVTQAAYDRWRGGTDPLSGSATYQEARKRGYLAVGVQADQPGMSVLDSARDSYRGFEADLARHLASDLGFERTRFIPVSSHSRELHLKRGNVDLIVAGYGITAARQRQVDFAGPYLLAGQSFLLRRDGPGGDGPEDLDGRMVCTVRDSSSELLLREQYPRVDVTLRRSHRECVSDLADNAVEAVSGDDVILAGLSYRHRDRLRLLDARFGREAYGVATARGDVALRQAVCDSLQHYAGSGAWRRSYDKHLAPLGLPASQAPKLVTCDDAPRG
ncbi:hypothetical protein GCM10027168_12070 [Streptomyces capparidis]